MENVLKRCLSAPVLPEGQQPQLISDGDIDNKINKNSEIEMNAQENNVAEQKNLIQHQQKQLQLQNKILKNLLIQDKITTANSRGSITTPTLIIGQNTASPTIFNNVSNSACSSPQRSLSREASPAPILNIFSSTKPRRYSASSFSPLNAGSGPRLTPRISQLRQEECTDMNSREINQEREMHSAIQMSQSWEDLTIVAENWTCKSSDDLSNPLQVTLPAVNQNCSSPSPTSSRTPIRMMPYGLSPSPTRRTSFTTRRSMSPIAMRPSALGPVKRKFDNFENDSNWSTCYSPPPFKKIFSESRGSSPTCHSPSYPSPADSGTSYDGGRLTPKLFISKLCTSSTNSSGSNSNSSTPAMTTTPSSPDIGIDLQSDGSPTHTISSLEPMSCSNTTELIECSVLKADQSLNQNLETSMNSNPNENHILEAKLSNLAGSKTINNLNNNQSDIIMETVDISRSKTLRSGKEV